jgi:hypothetical protein
MKSAALMATIAATVNADCYLHNPRGSNNRLDEANRDRNNGNRVFDSQNNNRGGSNVGSLYYYEGTMVPMEWTNQHSCGNPNNNCEIVIQYMCDDRLRDGTTTNTIPTNSLNCYGWDCDTDVRYGRHESWDYYMNCANRERNKGLFTADQKLNGNQAIYTRQNPNGGRRGLECPEERDYYPYWGPTPWRDIAVLTNQPQRCEAYQAESQNVKDRWFCDLPYTARQYNNNQPIPISQEPCETYTYEDMTLNMTVTGVWRKRAAFGVAAPICRDNQWGRDNHLGNVGGGETAGFNWTVPADWVHERCAMRIRYNISTGDMPHFDSTATLKSQTLNASQNGSGNSNKNNGDTLPVLTQEIGIDTYGMNDIAEAQSRQYWLEGNPDVDAFGGLLVGQPIKLQLAINTAQFGRTFQDRTHRFAVRKRPEKYASAVVHNINVRGKRGNIVQTYPGTEYDFTPSAMHCRNGDYIHFQWTGSNTNPNNNAGQGRNGSDRHNVVVLAPRKYKEVGQATNDLYKETYGQFGSSYPGTVNSKFLGFAKTDKRSLAVLDNMQFGGEMSELDDAGTYFDLGPRACTANGVYHYMSTRNNNFSNRSQKARIVVSDVAMQSLLIGLNGGSLALDGSSVTVEAKSLSVAQTIVISTYPNTFEPQSFEEQEGGAASHFLHILVQGAKDNKFALKSGKTVEVSVAYDADPVGYASLWTSSSLEGEWTEVEEAEFEDDKGTAGITKGGYYVVATSPNIVAIVFVTIAVLAAIGGIGYLCMKKLRGGDLSAMRGV